MSVSRTERRPPSVGDQFARGLADALKQMRDAPLAGSRNLPALFGIAGPTRRAFTETQDNVLLRAIEILRAGGRFYCYGNSVVVERDGDSGQSLRTLVTGGVAEPSVEYELANHFICHDDRNAYPPPHWFAELLMRSELLPAGLPRIRQYANRPLFDGDFILRSPKWHPDVQMLIHGPIVEPILHSSPDTTQPAVDRLPPLLKQTLRGFCFRADADVANALAALLTGLLANHFIDSLKGFFLVDGNQPGLGKTLLVRVIGTVLDGMEPPITPFNPDDAELEKRLCAQFRHGVSSIVLIDNGKTANGSAVSSAALESNSMSPVMTFRILGKSEVIIRPNNLVWMMTMNSTRVSPDLLSRGVPIRMAYEGRPEHRQFPGPDPIRCARENRIALLGELAGLVIKWNQAGRPSGAASHRCHEWAHTIGGILEVAGFPEFLANYAEAASSFNLQLQMAAALVEAVIAMNGPFIAVDQFRSKQ